MMVMMVVVVMVVVVVVVVVVIVVVGTIKETCLWGTLATPSPTSPSLSSLFTLPLYSV